MTSLNRYRDHFDTNSKEGIYLVNAAINDFKCPLPADELINLRASDAQTFISSVKRLASQYGWDFMLSNVPTVRTVTPAAIPGDPDVITFGGHINMLEHYSADNIDNCQKFASLLWGDQSFTAQPVQTIRTLTVATGHLTNHVPSRLTQAGRNAMRDRMHSKMMAHQVLALLSKSACASIELHRKKYTWRSQDGREVEMDGPTIVALIMSRLKPHYKVDMFTEIAALKKITLGDHKNNVQAFFDDIKEKKILIDQKDPTAYTDQAFLRDIFAQLKEAPVDDYSIEYKRQETKWLMGKRTFTSDVLMDEAELHYVNLVESNRWKPEHGSKEQIIALTTQIKSLEAKLSDAASNPKTSGKSGAGAGSTAFPLWRLKKVENGKTHSVIEKDGKLWYWCEDGHAYNGEKCGMYCLHKPGDGHKLWQQRKDENKQRRGKYQKPAANSEGAPPAAAPPAAPPAAAATDKKLALSQNLQQALMTQAGLSGDHFQKIWDECCSKSEN